MTFLARLVLCLLLSGLPAAGFAAAPAATARLSALPLTLAPAPGGGDTLSVFYSGDGGWAATDRGVADSFVRAGIPVVGVNSLSYFLTRKTPDGAAADLTLVLRHYMAAWNKSRIVLGGYSFGAGALPLIVPRLPADLRARIRLVALVDPEKAAELQFQPGDWLNLAAVGSEPIGPAMAGLRGLPLVCVYGEAERGAACASLPPGLGRAIPVPGGHHYDGNYALVGREILGSLPN